MNLGPGWGIEPTQDYGQDMQTLDLSQDHVTT